MEEFECLQSLLSSGLRDLTQLWTEIGVEDESRNDRKKTVLAQFKKIIVRMLHEEKGYKAKVLDNLETNSNICNKLGKEMGVASTRSLRSREAAGEARGGARQDEVKGVSRARA